MTSQSLSTDIQARLETLEMLVSVTLDAMPPDAQIYELARLQTRLALMDGLPELKANILRAWLDVHEMDILQPQEVRS